MIGLPLVVVPRLHSALFLPLRVCFNTQTVVGSNLPRKIPRDTYVVHGKLWENSKGYGKVKLYVKGHKTKQEYYNWGDRQFEGIIECNALQTDILRTSILEGDKTWMELDSKMKQLSAEIPAD